MVVDARRCRNAVLPAEYLDPPAPGVVKVSSDRTDRALRRRGDRHVPKRQGQPLDEPSRDSVILRHAASKLALRSVCAGMRRNNVTRPSPERRCAPASSFSPQASRFVWPELPAPTDASVYRPLVAVSQPYFRDPESWKPSNLPAEAIRFLRQEFRKRFFGVPIAQTW